MSRINPKIKHVMLGFGDKMIMDHADSHGDFVAYNIDNIFKTVKNKTGKRLFTGTRVHYVFFKDPQEYLALCMLDEEYPKEHGLEFVSVLVNELKKEYPNLTSKSIPAEGFKSFKPTLIRLLKEYNSIGPDKLQLVKNEIKNTEGVVTESLNQLLERSAHIENMKEQVEMLSENSVVLMSNATSVRKQRERRKLCLMVGFGGGVCFVIYLILAFFCGIILQDCF